MKSPTKRPQGPNEFLPFGELLHPPPREKIANETLIRVRNHPAIKRAIQAGLKRYVFSLTDKEQEDCAWNGTWKALKKHKFQYPLYCSVKRYVAWFAQGLLRKRKRDAEKDSKNRLLRPARDDPWGSEYLDDLLDLDDQERKIFFRLYFSEESLEQVALSFGKSKEAVEAIIHKAGQCILQEKGEWNA